jgi:hypothetical protein
MNADCETPAAMTTATFTFIAEKMRIADARSNSWFARTRAHL